MNVWEQNFIGKLYECLGPSMMEKLCECFGAKFVWYKCLGPKCVGKVGECWGANLDGNVL